MFIGSLHFRKVVLSSIKGCDKSLKDDNHFYDDINLIIIDVSPEREVIETYISDNGLDNKVLLFSPKDRLEDKYNVIILIARMFILFSNVFGLNQYTYRLLKYFTPFYLLQDY